MRSILLNKKGFQMVEMVVVLQIMLLLIFGLIFFIMTVRDDVIMESAARSGARTYAITHSIGDAISKTKEELTAGYTKAQVTISGDEIVVTKNMRINLPFGGEYLFGLRKSAEFHREAKAWYYDKPAAQQGSPIDGYSGWTGNPFR